MKTNKDILARMAAAVLAAAMSMVLLSACGNAAGSYQGNYGQGNCAAPDWSRSYAASEPADSGSSADISVDSKVYKTAPVPPDTEPTGKSAAAADPMAPIAGLGMASKEAVAALADLKGDHAIMEFNSSNSIVNGVDIDHDHNPYDLTWHYGDPGTFICGNKNWGALYQAYVDACDWSLIFDADYYMARFPMLAVLYHNDEALLLEHFQTVGVHEGRTAKASFSLDEYTENCDKDLADLFGDAWECYAFYYMLNYDTEKNVDTSRKSGTHDWICVELSRTQQIELEHVNEYRAEVGAAALEPHPELVALANYRAWVDAYNGIAAHDWLDMSGNLSTLYKYLGWMGVHAYGENTVKGWKAKNPMLDATYLNYRDSKSHYDAMVSKEQQDFGTSNCYWSAHTAPVAVSFDVYSDVLLPANTLKK